VAKNREAPEVGELGQAIERLVAKHGTFKMELDFGVVVSLVATIQLALRHPGNRGPTAKQMRGFCDQVIAKMGKSESRLAELLRQGYELDFDVPVGRN
jgi:hypothetical protein